MLQMQDNNLIENQYLNKLRQLQEFEENELFELAQADTKNQQVIFLHNPQLKFVQ